MNKFQHPLLGLDLSGRSPFSSRSAIGLPPAMFTPPQVTFVGGQAVVKGIPLARTGKNAQDYIVNPPAVSEDKSNSQPSFQAQFYGESGQFPVTLAAGIPQLVLKTPAKTRVQLLIQNINLAGVCAYNFGGAPSLGGSVNIGAGGNRVWDNAVPQGDLWLISNVPLVAVIEFINKDLANPNS